MWIHVSRLVMSLFVRPQRNPARLLCPWNSQARIQEWVAMPFSMGSSQPSGQTQVSCIAGRFFTVWTTWDTTPYLKRPDTLLYEFLRYFVYHLFFLNFKPHKLKTEQRAPPCVLRTIFKQEKCVTWHLYTHHLQLKIIYIKKINNLIRLKLTLLKYQSRMLWVQERKL